MILARNSRIPYYVIPQPLWGISIWNSSFCFIFAFLGVRGYFQSQEFQNFVIASEAKQSLGILNSSLGNSRIYSREFQNSLLCYCIFICIDISKYSSAKTISRFCLGYNFKTRICSRVGDCLLTAIWLNFKAIIRLLSQKGTINYIIQCDIFTHFFTHFISLF